MKLAFVGATGMVGREMLLRAETLPFDFEPLLFATAKSAGETFTLKGKTARVQPLPEVWPENIDYALMSAGSDLSKAYAPQMAATGTTVIDNSSAWRKEERIPLVVPEVNGALLKGYRGIIANPNCSTIQLVLALAPLIPWGLQQVVVSTYQAVSGAGRRGLEALQAEERGERAAGPFPGPIHRNALPLIGNLAENDFTEEENKLNFEPAKIMNLPRLQVRATAVRLPVVHGHSESVWLHTALPLSKEEAVTAWGRAENVTYTPDLVTPLTHAESSDLTFVSRLRVPAPCELMFWCVAHNLRVGAATNACRVLEKHVQLNHGGTR